MVLIGMKPIYVVIRECHVGDGCVCVNCSNLGCNPLTRQHIKTYVCQFITFKSEMAQKVKHNFGSFNAEILTIDDKSVNNLNEHLAKLMDSSRRWILEKLSEPENINNTII